MLATTVATIAAAKIQAPQVCHQRRFLTVSQTRTPLGVQFPDWWARWFEVVPTWETLGAQLIAAALVVGSYFAAEYVRVRAPRRRGDEPAVRTTEPSLSR